MRRKRAHDSFKHATEGVLHCFRTQRHMQIHFIMLVLVLASGLMLALDKRDMVILLFCISLVIATEMVNTAVETVVDMVTQTYHPLAKLAKDVAAGAVLVASSTATIAGVLILFGSEPLREAGRGVLQVQARSPDVTVVLVVGILVVTVTVVMSKVFSGRSNEQILRGGIVSGHSAIGFFLAMTIIFTSDNRFVQLIALLMAVIIAQSRVEAGVHSVQEVVLGAVVAVFLTSSVYWLMPMLQEQLAPRARPAHASSVWVEKRPYGQCQYFDFRVRARSRT